MSSIKGDIGMIIAKHVIFWASVGIILSNLIMFSVAQGQSEPLQTQELSATFVSQGVDKPLVSVHVAGRNVWISTASPAELTQSHGAEQEAHILGLVVQDMEGQTQDHQFIVPPTEASVLSQGGVVVVSFYPLDYTHILGLRLGIVSGFPGLSVATRGVSLQDALNTQANSGAVFGFGVFRN